MVALLALQAARHASTVLLALDEPVGSARTLLTRSS